MSSFPWVVAAMMAVLSAWYQLRHHQHPADQYVPLASWLRAGIYFCFCYLVAWFSGALPAALAGPVATAEQLADPLWRIWVLGLFALVTVGYWIIWARFTIRFERRLELLPQVFFGLCWGLASGFLFLAFWHIVAGLMPFLPTWAIWILSYLLISVWQALWQDYGWDVYVSPEHDCPWSIALKVPATHIPNVTFCLIFFAIYENYWIFVGLQTWALLGASIAMRMPSPWNNAQTPPALQSPGLFGPDHPHATGYETDDLRGDPLLRSTGLPAGTTTLILQAHLLSTLSPLLLFAVLGSYREYIEGIVFAPQLLYMAGGLIMLGGIYEIARNPFAHDDYLQPGAKALSGLFPGTVACIGMALLVTAYAGQQLLFPGLFWLLALAYPAVFRFQRIAAAVRTCLGLAMAVTLYRSLGDPIVFLSLVGIVLVLYFGALLQQTRSMGLLSLVALFNAHGMLTLSWAIYNGARGDSLPNWLVLVVGALTVVGVMALWPRLVRLRPTPNARAVGD